MSAFRRLSFILAIGAGLAHAQDLEFRSEIVQVTNLAGVDHGAWSPDGAHFYAVTATDGTLVVFTSDETGALTRQQVLRDGADGVDGLAGGSSVAVAPDGNHVYATGSDDDALAVFARDADTGLLTYVETRFHGVDGVDGLNNPAFVVVSPDNLHVYARASDAVSVFERDTATGELTFLEVERNTDFGSSELTQLSISPDGENVYAVADSQGTLNVFTRDATTGLLTFVQFFEEPPLFGGPTPETLPGLDGVNGVAVSPDGGHVYAVGRFDDTILAFSRDPADGTLTHLETLEDGVDGVDGLNGAFYVAVSPDGKHVYVAATADDAVSVFARDESTGLLTFVQALFDDTDGVVGLEFPRAVIVSPDGMLVHAISRTDRNLVAFQRSSADGSLSLSAVTVDQTDILGLSGVSALVQLPGRNVFYTAGTQDDAIGVFRFDPASGGMIFVEAQRDGVSGVTGLDAVADLAVTPDARFVYAAGPVAGAVAVFEIIGVDGELAFVTAVSNGGLVTGLRGARGLALSADGRDLYVAGSSDGALVHFVRDFETGQLIFREAFLEGTDGISGLDRAEALAISPDGTLLLAVSAFSSQVAIFARDPATGQLTYQPATAAKGFGPGAKRIIYTRDGLNFFMVTESPQKLFVFQIDLVSGNFVLTQIQELDGTGTSVTTNADGTRVYVTNFDTDSVEIYARDAETGLITLVTDISNGEGGIENLDQPRVLVELPSGQHVLVGSEGAIQFFDEAGNALTPDVAVSKSWIPDLSSPIPLPFSNFLLSVDNVGRLPTTVDIADPLPPGAVGGAWEVLASPDPAVPQGTMGEGPLTLQAELDAGESMLIAYSVDHSPGAKIRNVAAVAAPGDANADNDVDVELNERAPIMRNGFEDLFGFPIPGRKR